MRWDPDEEDLQILEDLKEEAQREHPDRRPGWEDPLPYGSQSPFFRPTRHTEEFGGCWE
jgi:hypothetical protein